MPTQHCRRDDDGSRSRENFREAESGKYCQYLLDCFWSPAAARKGTAYYASKFAVRGMTECWRAELRKHNVRVMLVNPSEVVTDFFATNGLAQNVNESKLRGEEIACMVKAVLEMDDRGFVPEVTVFATNPVD